VKKIKILKENFSERLYFAGNEMGSNLSGQPYLIPENAVPEDAKVLFWDFENKIIQGSYNLCAYQYEENMLVHIDFISKEFFEISLNGTFFSNPEFFQLTLGREYKIKNGDTLQVEMNHHALIMCIL
jgi:hypothetical protein